MNRKLVNSSPSDKWTIWNVSTYKNPSFKLTWLMKYLPEIPNFQITNTLQLSNLLWQWQKIIFINIKANYYGKEVLTLIQKIQYFANIWHSLSPLMTLLTPLTIWHYLCNIIQKQPSKGILRKRCSENMQQIYRRTLMPKCDFNKAAKNFYWNHTLAWVFFFKFHAYFQDNFSKNHVWKTTSHNRMPILKQIYPKQIKDWCNVNIS